MIRDLLALRPISHITKKTLSYLHSTKTEQMTNTMVIFKRGASFLCRIRCDPIPPQTSVQRLAHTRNVTTCCCKTTARERQKSVLHVQICFLLIRRKSVLHVQFVFLLIRSISLEPFSLSSSLSVTQFNFFCLHVLLTRASLLALAKSMYYTSISLSALRILLRIIRP